jgi:hypothetical protein
VKQTTKGAGDFAFSGSAGFWKIYSVPPLFFEGFPQCPRINPFEYYFIISDLSKTFSLPPPSLYHKHYKRINNDLLKSQGMNKTKIQNLCRSYLEEGKSVVIDNMNADPIQRYPWIKMGEDFNAREDFDARVRGAATHDVISSFSPIAPL